MSSASTPPPRSAAALAALRDPLREALAQGHVVLSAPTGTGKSTQVPRWIAATGARVLVVEPRRVACRALYRHLSAPAAGRDRSEARAPTVGYVVRHEQESPDAQVLFVTPGVAARLLAEGQRGRFDVVVLDEFHERRMDVDLLLAVLLRDAEAQRLVVMSATLDAKRVARHLGARSLAAEARNHPVEIRHADGPDLPDTRDLAQRVLRGVEQALAATPEGDVLVFLPGKGEIREAEALLGRALDLPVLPLHGALDRRSQDRAFETGPGRKVILATNVAESSVTLPGVRAVVDSGLERRTSYRRARSVLSLSPISAQSAEQRAGRAGRLGPGVAIRLWSRRAVLRAETPPEILREDLDPLLLMAASLGARVSDLPWLDAPDPRAVAAAQARLEGLGLLDGDGRLTDLGRAAARLPVDPPLARLLLEGQRAAAAAPEGAALADALVDLVATLAAPAPFWHVAPEASRQQPPKGQRRGRGAHSDPPSVSPEQSPCDATLRIQVLRQGRAPGVTPRPFALQEARRIAEQLRRLLAAEASPAPPQTHTDAPDAPRQGRTEAPARRAPHRTSPDRLDLARLVVRADPAAAFVRRRSRFAGAGMEATLGRDSRVDPGVEALVVLETHSERTRGMRATHQITCAIPVSRAWLARQGLGEPEIQRLRLEGGQILGRVRQTLAGVALAEQETPLQGALAVQAAARLVTEGRLFRGVLPRLEEQLRLLDIHFAEQGAAPPPVPVEPAAWLAHRLAELGLESGEDLALLEADDLLPERPFRDALAETAARFPATVRLPDRTCEAHYDFARRAVELRHRSGNSRTPPAPSALPPLWPGWSVVYCVHSRRYPLR